MGQTRRHFPTKTAAAVGSITLLPNATHAAGHSSDVFTTDGGDITVHPVGDASAYSGFPSPNLILITDQHGDHYKAETLAALVGKKTQIITNPAVYDMLPADLKTKASQIANGESATFKEFGVDAMPVYNTTEGRLTSGLRAVQFDSIQTGAHGRCLSLDGSARRSRKLRRNLFAGLVTGAFGNVTIGFALPYSSCRRSSAL